MVLKLIQKFRGPRIATSNFVKEGRLELRDFNVYCKGKAIIIKTLWKDIEDRLIDQWNKIESAIDKHTYSH